MKYFAGLDVALEETANSGVDETGQMMKEACAAGEPEARDALLSNLGLPLERLGLQACPLTAWLHGELKATDPPAIGMESRQAKAAIGAMPNKTGRNSLQTVWRAPSPKSSEPAGSARGIERHRLAILAFASGRAPDGSQRDAVDRKIIAGHLARNGRKLKTPARKDFVVRARERIGGDDILARTIEPLLEIVGLMLREFARLTKQVLDSVRVEPICRRLMSTPASAP